MNKFKSTQLRLSRIHCIWPVVIRRTIESSLHFPSINTRAILSLLVNSGNFASIFTTNHVDNKHIWLITGHMKKLIWHFNHNWAKIYQREIIWFKLNQSHRATGELSMTHYFMFSDWWAWTKSKSSAMSSWIYQNLKNHALVCFVHCDKYCWDGGNGHTEQSPRNH